MFPIVERPSAQSAAITIAMPARMSGLSSRCAEESGRTGDDGAVRVAEDDPRAHRDELVDEEEPALEHLLEDEHRPRRLRRRDDRDRREVGGERGPDAALDLRDLAAEVVDARAAAAPAGTRSVDSPTSSSMPSLRNAGTIEIRSSGSTSSIIEVAARDGREGGEARDLDVLRADAVRPAAEPLDALDVEDVRADALDPRAERDEEAAEILDVRLARGMADDRLALREHGRHDRVLGRHHRRLVEVQPLPDEAARLGGRRRRSIAISTPSSANAWMCVSRRRRPITSPPGGGTTARPKRASSGPASRNEARISRQRSGSSSVFVMPELSTRTSFGPDPGRVGAEVGEQLDHHLDVADARQVRQAHLLGGEHGGGEDRQGAVLVPGRADRAGDAGDRPG